MLPVGMPPRAAVMPLLYIRGDWSEARHLAEITRSIGSPVERQLAIMLVGLIARHQGDAQLAWSAVGELLPQGPTTAPGGRLFPCANEMQRLAADLALNAGDLASARTWLEAHDEWLAWSGAVRGQAESELLWAEYAWVSGDRGQARMRAHRALDLAATPRQPLAQIAAHRLLGRFSAADGRIDDAEGHLASALRLADACVAPFERALVLLTYGEMYVKAQRRNAAIANLDEVRAICAALNAEHVLERATALAAETAAPPASLPANLSAREVEVLRLVAEGLTDPEVAERLFISPRTVSQHLRSIYNKLGVSSRAGATRFAVQYGLV